MPRGLSSLDAHVAQHGVEIERGHIECLRHLRRRQRVLGGLVQQLQGTADNGISSFQDFPAAQFTSFSIASGDITTRLANLRQHLGCYPNV